MRTSRFQRGAGHREDRGAGSTHCVDGMTAAEMCRRYGLSPATLYKLEAKYGGMEVSEARRLRDLESENARLKKLLADTLLEKTAIEEALRRKW